VQKRLWTLTERHFTPDRANHHETLFTVGNGYLGTRGTFEEGAPGEIASTMVHGIYDHIPGALVPELVNAPNWLPIAITIDGTPFSILYKTSDIMRPPEGVVFGYERNLHLDQGVLRRSALFRAASGAIVRIVFERFASLYDDHVLAQRVIITGVDGTPTIEVRAALHADVTNSGAQHWLPDPHISADADAMALEVTTQQSGYRLAMASRLIGEHAVEGVAAGLRPAQTMRFTLAPEQTVTLDKLTAVFTTRDTETPLEAAHAKLREAAARGYDVLFAEHAAEWDAYWATSDIVIEGDEECQLATRFTTYHILITAPRHSETVSIGAKTLSGMGYKGHVFWDTELFALPLITLTHPQVARNLLMYRYHNLPGARNKAKANGYEGAMFPWESTDTGEETTPQWSDVQPDGSRIRIWTGDNEQHISTDIAYAVLQFWRYTGDDEYFRRYGAEIVLDTAVFWGSRVEHANGRYEITQQIGPDEYHENIDNSVFVNRMTQWHLEQALKTLDWLRAHSPDDAARLSAALDLTPERIAHWRDVIANLYIPFDTEQAIHIQFPGFFDMEYIPVPHYEPRTTSVQAILGHARSIQTQVIKQADVVMMMALLGDALGVPAGYDVRQVCLNNWNTYYPRTDHGSSLSPAMHAWVAARLGLHDVAYEMFHHAAHIDLHDNKGNVRDGIHAAACGGVWQAAVFGFCGLHIDDTGGLAVAPNLPAHWRSVAFSVSYRGQIVRFTLTHEGVTRG
jgi:kojibiose phosphorylase